MGQDEAAWWSRERSLWVRRGSGWLRLGYEGICLLGQGEGGGVCGLRGLTLRVRREMLGGKEGVACGSEGKGLRLWEELVGQEGRTYGSGWRSLGGQEGVTQVEQPEVGERVK